MVRRFRNGDVLAGKRLMGKSGGSCGEFWMVDAMTGQWWNSEDTSNGRGRGHDVSTGSIAGGLYCICQRTEGRVLE